MIPIIMYYKYLHNIINKKKEMNFGREGVITHI